MKADSINHFVVFKAYVRTGVLSRPIQDMYCTGKFEYCAGAGWNDVALLIPCDINNL